MLSSDSSKSNPRGQLSFSPAGSPNTNASCHASPAFAAAASSNADENCYKMFDVNFDFDEDAGLLAGIPYASLTEDSNVPFPDSSTSCALGSAGHTDTLNLNASDSHAFHTAFGTHTEAGSLTDSAFPLESPLESFSSFGGRHRQSGSRSAGVSAVTPSSGSVDSTAAHHRGLKVVSPFSQLHTEGRVTNSGTSSSPLSSSDKSNANSGHSGSGSECGSAIHAAAAVSPPILPAPSTAAHADITATSTGGGGGGGKNKNFFEHIACLPEDNFNVLTPDKHVMLSIPARYIVPTNGSRNYVKKNRGAPCSAEDLNTNSHGNTIHAKGSWASGSSQAAHRSGLAAKPKKMFFSFCLCKAYSVVGAHCHHGNECDFIHCVPEKLPQVVSTDSGTIIDEIIERKERQQQMQRQKQRHTAQDVTGDTSGDSAVLPRAVLGTKDSISTFQVHWSTPVATLQDAPYACLPAGNVVYIKKENSRNNLQAIPSELIYKTVGVVEAMREGGSAHMMHKATGNGPHPGDSRTPLRICKHFEREKCARGPLCHFIHPVVLSENANAPSNFSAFMNHQNEQQRRAAERFQRSQQQVNAQREARQLTAAVAANQLTHCFGLLAPHAPQGHASTFHTAGNSITGANGFGANWGGGGSGQGHCGPMQQQQQQQQPPPPPCWAAAPAPMMPPRQEERGPCGPPAQQPAAIATTEQLMALLTQMAATAQPGGNPHSQHPGSIHMNSVCGNAVFLVQNPNGTLGVMGGPGGDGGFAPPRRHGDPPPPF